jgi:hypothetical protein
VLGERVAVLVQLEKMMWVLEGAERDVRGVVVAGR